MSIDNEGVSVFVPNTFRPAPAMVLERITSFKNDLGNPAHVQYATYLGDPNRQLSGVPQPALRRPASPLCRRCSRRYVTSTAGLTSLGDDQALQGKNRTQ